MPTFAPTPQTTSTVKVNNEQLFGNDISTTAPGVQLVSIAGATGDPIDNVNNAMSVTGQIAGLKSTNAQIPSLDNIGSLDAVANAVAPTYKEGYQVLLSSDLRGNQRTILAGGLFPTNTALTTYSVHLTTNTTTTPTSATAYISSIAISNEVGGTTSTVTIQDKQGTPLKLINGVATTALTTAPTVINFQTPVIMVSGIDIITAGAVAATVDVWIDYYV